MGLERLEPSMRFQALHAILAHDLARPWHQLREHGDSEWLAAMEGMGDDY